jgi:ankyrin repeat protein
MSQHIEAFVPAMHFFIGCVAEINSNDIAAFQEPYHKLKEITSFDEGYFKSQQISLLGVAVSFNNKDIITFLAKDGLNFGQELLPKFTWSAVYPTIIESTEDMVQFLIKEIKYNLREKDEKGRSFIHHAADLGKANIIDCLLRNQYFNKTDLDSQDEQNRTPLWTAAKKGHLSVVKLLVAQGCNIDTVDNQNTTLVQIAAQQGHADIVNFLHEHKSITAGNNIVDNQEINMDLLYLAVKQGNLPETKRLIDLLKIDFYARNKNQDKLLALAASNGHLHLVEFLLERGSRIQFTKFYDNFFEDFVKKDNKQQLAIAKSPKYNRIIELLIMSQYGSAEDLPVEHKLIAEFTHQTLIDCLKDHASKAKDPNWRSAYKVYRKIQNPDGHKNNIRIVKD